MDQNLRTNEQEKLPVSDNDDDNSLQACKVSKEYNPAFKLQNLGTRISSNTLQKFRLFVLNKHGKINGPFSQEVDKALNFWMDNQQQTTSCAFSSSRFGRPRSDKIEKFREIVKQLQLLKSFPLVNHFTLINTIQSVLGVCDKRTLNNYLTSVKKNSKEEITPFGTRPMVDVSRFVKKIQSDDW